MTVIGTNLRNEILATNIFVQQLKSFNDKRIITEAYEMAGGTLPVQSAGKSEGGLYDDQIDKIMDKEGVISSAGTLAAINLQLEQFINF